MKRNPKKKKNRIELNREIVDHWAIEKKPTEQNSVVFWRFSWFFLCAIIECVLKTVWIYCVRWLQFQLILIISDASIYYTFNLFCLSIRMTIAEKRS